LGVNDGILSIYSSAIGITAASSFREPTVLKSIAGSISRALSMAAGEFFSVRSQMDVKNAGIKRQKVE
jgi:VIT1/CCC1 family predicted Fe2+/Mn2+ transporter